MRTLPLWLLTLALAALAGFSLPARAETFNTCAGFIDSLPATINAQGTWCLRGDLSTAITSGNAITINTNNVTIDCNHFKIGGLQAGDSSTAYGIVADNRLNATVRHCNIRGFYYGTYIVGGGGHLLEDNRFDQNLLVSIAVTGENNTVRRNAVYDTGGPGAFSYAIRASADVIDNTVSGVFATGAITYPTGITSLGSESVVHGNHVRGLVVAGSGFATGIRANGDGSTIDGNRVSAATTTAGVGISGAASQTACSNNTVINFVTAYSSCESSTHNVAL